MIKILFALVAVIVLATVYMTFTNQADTKATAILDKQTESETSE